MIKLTFKNWELCTCRAEPPAYQYDDGTVAVVVDGDIPSGWTWELLIAYGDNLDIASLVPSHDGLTVALHAQQLAFSGYYTMQLRASQGGLVKHSAPVMVYIGGSLSGDTRWPEIPTAFTQAIARAEAAIADAQEVQTAVAASETAAAQSASYAVQSATEAAGSATAAADAVAKYPRISTDTGNWEVWDADGGDWVDTGVHAQGQQGDPGIPGAVQDVTIDGQSVLTGGIATVNSASVTKSGMTGASPAWSQAEQLAARQRIGLDKEWVLVGTISGDESDRGNIDTGVDVDLSGCTELYFIGRAIATDSTSIATNNGFIIYNPIAANKALFAASFRDSYFGIECVFVKTSSSYTGNSLADNGSGYTAIDGRIIARYTKVRIDKPGVVTTCDIKIYAR